MRGVIGLGKPFVGDDPRPPAQCEGMSMLFHSCRVTRHVCSPPSRQIQKRRPLIDHRRASQGRHDRQGPLEPVEDPAVREVELARRQAQPRPGHREPGSPPSLLAAPTSAPPLPSGAEASSGQLAHLFTRCATKRNAFTLAILIAYALTRFGVLGIVRALRFPSVLVDHSDISPL